MVAIHCMNQYNHVVPFFRFQRICRNVSTKRMWMNQVGFIIIYTSMPSVQLVQNRNESDVRCCLPDVCIISICLLGLCHWSRKYLFPPHYNMNVVTMSSLDHSSPDDFTPRWWSVVIGEIFKWRIMFTWTCASRILFSKLSAVELNQSLRRIY